MATAIAATTTDKKAILRDKRAQGIAAMGLVTRAGDRFQVQTPSLRGRRASYEVWRDETGKIRCSCLEFEEHTAADAGYRCEHILAVKHSLAAKNTEAVTKQQPAQKPAISLKAAANKTADAVAAITPEANNQIASEKPAESSSVSFGREQNETEEAATKSEPLADVSNIRSLANTRHEEDMNMKKQHINAPVTESETKNYGYDMSDSDAENVMAEDTVGAVVPLAFTNTLRTLRQPVDPKLVRTREGWTDRQGNKHMVEYVEWHTVADILDRVYPTWSHAVKNIAQIGDMVAVTAAITIDNVTREGVGTGTADNETGIKKAEHDALKRAAIKFGIARDLYQRETEVIEREGSAPQAGEFPRDPLAKSMSDLVTPKQLGMIRALAREANVEVEAECQTALRCRTDELSKRAASSFIDHLKNLGQEAAAVANGGMRRAS
ncbi:MAG: SWIM zinc finger family protein [Pyrinomonadaceae bacterium]|nr:SWIM zinc finger family protein [Pyrinomonadaceae bacterium]